jgi:histidine triad (HIT) family protein
MADCIFCKIVGREIPAHIIQEDENVLAFLDVNPVNPGHLLIIPKVHVESVFDMPDEQYKNIFETAKALSTPLQNAMQSRKIGIAVEGFGVPHAHVHLVPLHNPNELNPERATHMDDETLATIAEKIAAEVTKAEKAEIK